MGIIADLFVRVGADVAPFTAGMKKVEGEAEATSASVSKMGGLIGGAGLVAAGALTGIAAFGIAAVQHSQEAGQAAYEMSEKFGLLPEQASAYLSVGKQLGLTNEQVSKGFQFLSKNVSGMALTLEAGGKISATQGQVYKDLGINVLDSGGKVKSANELMLEAADAFQGMSDGPEKAALSMKLFGKSGTDLLPMLNQGRGGIEKLMATGKAQGEVMSGPQVAAAHKLYLEHKQLDSAIAGVSNQFGAALLPALVGLIPIAMGVLGWFGHIHETITQLQPWFPLLAAGLTLLGGVMAAVLIPMFIAWTVATWAQVVALAAQAVALIAATWPILLIIIALAAVVAAVVLVIQHWDFLKAKTLEVWSAIKTHVLGIVEWFKGLPGAFLEAAKGIGAGILNGILAGLSGAGTALMGVIKGMLPGGAGGAVALALHAAGIPGFATGGIIQGPYSGAPVLILGHAGERVSTEAQQMGGGGGGGGGADMSETNHLLRALLEAVTAPPPSMTGGLAYLQKAVGAAALDRSRGIVAGGV